MTNVPNTPDPTPITCPRNTPWCVRHDDQLNFCWSKDVQHLDMVLNLCNGTTTGEPKIFGLEDGPEVITLGAAESLERALAEFRAMAGLTTPTKQPIPVPMTTQHASWCVDHDKLGDFCWSQPIEAAGLELYLANSDQHIQVVGLNDPSMPDVLGMEDVVALTEALRRFQDLAVAEDTPSMCSRFTWCALVGDPDHDDECASLVHQARDLAGELWSVYLQCSAQRDVVQLCIDGRVRGVPMSGRIPATDALAVVSTFHNARESMLGLWATVESVRGYDAVKGLLTTAVEAPRTGSGPQNVGSQL